MIFTTGGRASGATSTRSRPRSCAAARASSTVITPSCAPSGAITRRGLIRICLFTRMRGALLFVLSIARCRSPPQREVKSGFQPPGIRVSSLPDSPRRRAERGNGSEGSTLEHSPTLGEAAGEAHAAPACHIVAPKLARLQNFHKTKSLPFPCQPSRHHRRVVLEHQEPALRLGAPVQLAAGLERHQRLEVVSHDPGEGEMGAGG